MTDNKNKYQNGKIYKIIDRTNGNYYIGSTTKLLEARLKEHEERYSSYLKKIYNNVTSFTIVQNNDYYIELIQNYPCNNKIELLRKEGEYIKNADDKCVNRCVAGRTLEEYYQDNRERLIVKQKKHYYANPEKKIKYQSEYVKKNKEKVKKYLKEYREKNLDSINAKKKVYMKEFNKQYRNDPNNKLKIYQLKRMNDNKRLITKVMGKINMIHQEYINLVKEFNK